MILIKITPTAKRKMAHELPIVAQMRINIQISGVSFALPNESLVFATHVLFTLRLDINWSGANLRSLGFEERHHFISSLSFGFTGEGTFVETRPAR